MLSERDRRLSRLALDHRYLTRRQLDECLPRIQALGASLEQVLLERGYLTPGEIHELDRLGAEPPRFAEVARDLGLASESQVLDALRLKAELAAVDVHRPVGQILVERAVLSDTQVVTILAEQTRRMPARRGAFRLGEPLPRVSTGIVHRATHEGTGREAVVKSLRGASDALPRLLRAREFDHPNLARVLDVGTDGDVLWIASDYVEGLPLYDHVVGSIRLPVEEATAILKQVVAGLGAAHRAGLPHGRLTSRNVLLTEMREVRVTDLALSPGTPASDLQACGALWAFMLDGETRTPSRAGACAPLADAIRARAQAGRYARLSELAEDLDRLDEEILHRAHLADAAADATPAPSSAPAARPRRPARRRRR